MLILIKYVYFIVKFLSVMINVFMVIIIKWVNYDNIIFVINLILLQIIYNY